MRRRVVALQATRRRDLVDTATVFPAHAVHDLVARDDIAARDPDRQRESIAGIDEPEVVAQATRLDEIGDRGVVGVGAATEELPVDSGVAAAGGTPDDEQEFAGREWDRGAGERCARKLERGLVAVVVALIGKHRTVEEHGLQPGVEQLDELERRLRQFGRVVADFTDLDEVADLQRAYAGGDPGEAEANDTTCPRPRAGSAPVPGQRCCLRRCRFPAPPAQDCPVLDQG